MEVAVPLYRVLVRNTVPSFGSLGSKAWRKWRGDSRGLQRRLGWRKRDLWEEAEWAGLVSSGEEEVKARQILWTQLFPVLSKDFKRGNGPKFKLWPFRLDAREIFLAGTILQHWKRLPTASVKSLSLKVFNTVLYKPQLTRSSVGPS